VLKLNDDTVLKDIFSDRTAMRNIFVFYGVIILVVIYHSSVFMFVEYDNIKNKDTEDMFSVMFEETQSFQNDSRTVNDGETESVEFTAAPSLFDDYTGFGLLEILVTYSETSGEPTDQCDVVSVNIPPNGAIADWENENNVLSGTSDDCSDISLLVLVYPDYDGIGYNVSGGTQNSWEDFWSDQSYGHGTFTIDVEVEVRQPVIPLPFGQDSDEEVEITWTAHFFDVTVE
jgi:hypothetical protein